MDNPEVHDITNALPTLETDTRDKVKKGLLAVTAAGAALLAFDTGVKAFRNRKSVKVVVEDKVPSETPSSL